MKTKIIIALAAAVAISIAAASAFAHVSLERTDAVIGKSYKAVFKVPHGCEGSPTRLVRVTIPEGVIGVKPMPKPGWTITMTKGKFARAYGYHHGAQLSEGVKEVTWTGGPLLDEHFDEFVVSGFIARELTAGSTLHFPVTQVCESGELHWSEVAATGQDPHSLKAPAPSLRLVAGEPGPVAAARFSAGPIVVETPWSRATPGGATVAAGYFKITNTGQQADRLLGGVFPAAGRVEVHDMTIEGDVMKMRHLADGLVIAPGATVELKPGSLHLMLLDLKDGLTDGQTVKGRLEFERAGAVEIELKVGPTGSQAPGHSHH